MNPVVEAVGQLNITGNVIPHTWFSHPAFRDDSNNIQMNAILLMADILYWYRPTIVRDEESGRISSIKQKFAKELLYKRYATWSDQFGMGVDTLRRALRFLEERGLIKRHVRTAEFGGKVVPNAVFIELFVDAVKDTLSIPESMYEPHEPIVQLTGKKNKGGVDQMMLFDAGEFEEKVIEWEEFISIYPYRKNGGTPPTKGPMKGKYGAKTIFDNLTEKPTKKLLRLRHAVTAYAQIVDPQFAMNAGKWLSSGEWERYANIDIEEALREKQKAKVQHDKSRGGVLAQQAEAIRQTYGRPTQNGEANGVEGSDLSDPESKRDATPLW